jgi:pyruvate formate lyase activating enzyme
MQPHFAEALLRLANVESISTAMETCGHTDWGILERLLPYLNHILFDLKHIDPDVHRRFTGVGNKRILANLRQLAVLNAPLTIRVPLIPGFNVTPESLQAIAEFVLELNITGIDLLPYHTLGTSKYEALGRDYPWRGYERLQEADINTLADIIRARGLTVNIGG